MQIELSSQRLIIKTLDESWYQAVTDYQIRNREFLKPWNPTFPEGYFTPTFQRLKLIEESKLMKENKQYRFFLFPKGESSKIIGHVGLSNIIMGCFCSCFIGYESDAGESGKGIMSEALKPILDFAFNDLKLHRIEANIMPNNSKSIKLAEKFGFTREGMSRDYMKIDGKWQDHIHFALLNKNIL